jgi:hypothetical protein
MAISELDVVELGVQSGRWPAGTEGTVLERRDDSAVIEIADERGHTLEIVTVPVEALRRIETPQQQALL